MDFKSPEHGLPRGLAVGDKVSFEFYMDAQSLPQLTAVTVLAPESKAAAAASASGSKP
jgi:Cu(I)/Ag(I) efflux system membrane fusion protein